MFTNNSSQNSLKQGAFERLIPSSLLRAWLIFFAGIAFGLVFFILFFADMKTEKPGVSDLAGSMYSPNNSAQANLQVNVEEVQATITTGFLRDNYLQTVIEMESADAVKLSFDFSSSDFAVTSLRTVEQSAESSISGGPGFVNISSQGSSKFVFLLKAQNRLANRLDIKIYSDNRIVYGNSITVGN